MNRLFAVSVLFCVLPAVHCGRYFVYLANSETLQFIKKLIIHAIQICLELSTDKNTMSLKGRAPK